MKSKLTGIFREVFEDDSLDVPPTLSQQSYAPWDSFAQVKLIIALQEEFDIRFTTSEAIKLTSVDTIEQALQEKGVPG